MTSAAAPATTDALPALLDATQTAAYLGLGRSTFYRMDDAALVPRCMYLGKMRRWSRAELERWIAAGMPARSRWEAIR